MARLERDGVPQWLDRNGYSRFQPERLDSFLEELNAFCRDRGYPIAKGGIDLREQPGGDELPQLTIELIQLPGDTLERR